MSLAPGLVQMLQLAKAHSLYGAATQLRSLNDRLIMAERAFVDPEGLPGQPWYRHLVSWYIVMGRQSIWLVAAGEVATPSILSSHSICDHCSFYLLCWGIFYWVQVYAPIVDNGYGSQAFPGIAYSLAAALEEPSASAWEAVQHQVHKTARAIGAAAKVLSGGLS